ncbi:MAG: efflux RND transporter periplasmic adaptor subunit [Deltaproteobacteria bacterium]|nr:efflux RND transporter periplasmic adaptor subunit [Deltaproteobacteria bacterium]
MRSNANKGGRLRLTILVSVFVATTSLFLWSNVPRSGAAEPAAKGHKGSLTGEKGKKIKYWVAPMDPTYIRDKPGKSPMGMDLVPVYEDEDQKKNSGGRDESAIIINPVVMQNMGVRVEKVEKRDIRKSIRTVGMVDVAEDRISVVNLRFSGWVEKVFVDRTGDRVRRGQALFSMYSPELVTAQKELIIAAKAAGSDRELLKSAEERLRLWDLPEDFIESVLKKRRVKRNVVIKSPARGYVLHKAVVEGGRVQAGKDLYRIGDLKKIWVKAEVYEFQAPWVKEGLEASMELSFLKGDRFSGRVSYIYPTLNRRTRTLTIRLEFDNPGIELKPGMFATVWIHAQPKHDVLAIPDEAVIDTGERQVVFVSPRPGRYEAREVVTGLHGDGDVTEVLSGLKQGEVVVVSGQFMLDSESKLREAVRKLLSAGLQKPDKSLGNGTTGHDEEKKETFKAGNQEKDTYWTCSMHPQVVQDHPGTCPICGMNLVERKK